MAGRAVAPDGEIERVGLGAGERDQLGEIPRRQARRRRDDHGALGEQRDRREVGVGVVGRLQEMLVDHQIAGVDQQRVAVGRCLGDVVRADHRVGAGAILDHDALTPARRQALADLARQRVDRAAGRERHDDVDRMIGIGGARRHRRRQQQGGGDDQPARAPHRSALSP
jgi:hypothetical protein